MAGLLNRGILTFQKKAKVNIRKSFFWSAVIIATIDQTFPCAKHPTWGFTYSCDFILNNPRRQVFTAILQVRKIKLTDIE